ncbi:MAG: hypothetical protein KatS3mg085_396 [Candidatus Dojkabacteria bacterium]|nr:MAG: hypothetical protein KatS3mg085_396 [Candidatus Dojkabacteria bacterium]
MMNLLLFKTKKGYSLVEVVVSLAIIAIIITILFNTVLITIRISYKNFARSLIREELSEISTLISRDVRNADQILSCTGSACEMVRDGVIIRWTLCDSVSVCRQESQDGINYVNLYQTLDFIIINLLNFENGFGVDENLAQRNIVFTMVAEHSNPDLSISNVIRQQSVSTRNFSR